MASTQHLVLLGDSIFDNAVYVPNGPAVIDHVKNILPSEWRITLLARDGDVTSGVKSQLSRLPRDVTHLVISVGGNDALMALKVLSFPAKTVNDALIHLAHIRRAFQREYRAMLRQSLIHRLPLVVCTIYDAVPGLTAELQTALAIFNDTITRDAAAVGVPVLDLRHVCTEAADYSSISSIEPSAQGGRKIAEAITAWARITTRLTI